VMALGWIDPGLPGVKGITVSALEGPYTTKQAAHDSIKIQIEQFYRNTYPDVASRKHAEIERVVAEVQKIYSRNYFPEMGVSWRKFPDNVGHMYYPGCFRCHDGKHVSDEGKVLTRDCNTCHSILTERFAQDTLTSVTGPVEYHHPGDVGDAWKESNCSDCHGQ